MVKKKTKEKKSKKIKNSGMDLDDAFGDDEGVEYAKAKPGKVKKKGMSEDELEEQIQEIEKKSGVNEIEKRDITFNASKPIAKIKKGDKIKVDGKEYEVDAHYVMIDHKTTKEMALEFFDSKTDKDYQLRYFSDQVESTMELYELQEILYTKKAFSKVEW